MKNDDENFHANIAKAKSRERRRARDATLPTNTGNTVGVIDASGPQPGVTVKHDRSGPLPARSGMLPTSVDGHWRKLPKNIHSWLEHRYEMAARKARRAVLVSAGYDRATGRSVVRSVMRQMNGRWDGKPVFGGGAPNWGAMKP